MDLKLWNAPFKTNEEGLRMLNYSFDYIGGNSIIFYTVLPALKHAFSTCEFIFISSVFIAKIKILWIMLLKYCACFHEISHIYKRIYHGKKIENNMISSQIGSRKS